MGLPRAGKKTIAGQLLYQVHICSRPNQRPLLWETMSWAPANSIWATNLRGVICVVVVYTLLTLKSKLNGIDLELLNVLEARGKTKCDQILPTLRELHKTPSFHTPSFEVTIRRFPGGFYKDDFNDHDHNLSCFMLLVTSQQQDRTLDSVALVLSPDTIDEDIDILLRKLAQAPVVCLLNKMWVLTFLWRGSWQLR